MPLYEYKCDKCGAVLEVIQKVADPPLTKCAKCGGQLKKLISSPAIQFKGSGWYVTDYGHKHGPSPSEAPKKNNGQPKKTENKPTTEKSKDAAPSAR